MMKAWVNKFAISALTSMFAVGTGFAASDGQHTSSWNFQVWLDETPIGYHQVRIDRTSDRKTVHTQANFDVRFLFVPVYSYDHETREFWKDGCLINIESNTDDNGDDYYISSIQNKEQLTLNTQDGVKSLDGCIRTFAYWDIELLKSERLLNTQTGEYLSVSIKDKGTDLLAVGDVEVQARRFTLVAEDRVIDLWYAPETMRWLGLESVTESGAVLRYLPENVEQLALETQT